MLKLFSRNLFINVISLTVLAIGLQIAYIINPVANTVATPPIFDGLDIIVNSNSLLQLIVSVVLVVAQALLISRYVTIHRLSRSLTLIPGAIFIIYVYILKDPENLNILILANLFFVLSIGSLFSIYKKHQPIAALFNAGFFLGLASVFYFPYLIYLIALIIGLYNLRNFNLKEFLQILFGFLAVYFLCSVYAYYINLFDTWCSYILGSFSIPSFDFSDIHIWIKPIIFIAAVILITFGNNNLRKKKKYDAIRKIEFTYLLFFLSLLSIFMTEDIIISHLIIASVPMAILGGMLMERKEFYYFKEFIFLLLVGYLLAISYNYL